MIARASTSDIATDKRGHKPRTRRDIASGDALDPAGLIRLALGPDGQICPDFGEKIPGRGAWIAGNRAAVKMALKKGAFARAFKCKVSAPDDLADMIEAGLRARFLGMLGMARRAGALVSGFDQVKSLASAGTLGLRVEACDGSADGRGKIRVIAKAAALDMELPPPNVVGVFTQSELGGAIGRAECVHIGVLRGKLAGTLRLQAGKLAGFTPLVPTDWPDKAHEPDWQANRVREDGAMPT